MDSITHALVAILVFSNPLQGAALLSAVLGAVLPDCDVLLHALSDRDPRLFIFTHGGFTHSLGGIPFIAAGVTAGFLAWAGATGQDPPLPAIMGTIFFPALGGALTHVTLDLLAFPGIPLLYPLRERKMTVGIFPGPSILLLLTSIGFLCLSLFGLATMQWLQGYGVFIAGIVVARAGLRGIAETRFGRRTVPTFNPLKWLVIRDCGDAYRVFFTYLFSSPKEERVYPKGSAGFPGNLSGHVRNPEVRRLLYNSYILVARREEGGTLLYDPVREDGFIFYPPRHTRVFLRDEEAREG